MTVTLLSPLISEHLLYVLLRFMCETVNPLLQLSLLLPRSSSVFPSFDGGGGGDEVDDETSSFFGQIGQFNTTFGCYSMNYF